MATLADLWEAEAPAKSTKVPDLEQAKRDKLRMDILQGELTAAQQRLAKGDSRAQADINALTREMGGKVTPVPAAAPAPAPAASNTLADLWESTPAAGEPNSPVPKKEPSKVKSLVADILGKGFEARQAMQDFVRPAYEVGGTLLGGAAGAVLGPVAGVIENIQSGKYGTPEGIKIGEQKAAAVQRALMPDVTTPTGQAILGGLQKVADVAKIPPVGAPELVGMTPLGQAATQQGMQAVSKGIVAPIRKAAAELEVVRPGQLTPAQAQAQFAAKQSAGVSMGAAASDLPARIREVAAKLPENEAKQLLAADPSKVDIAAAERRAVANKFGIELTKGEAKQDASLLGDEFNAKKESPELQQRLVERSEKLFRGLDDIKERTAPDIYTSDKTELGQRIIDSLQAKDAARRAEISGLYKQLEDANAGSLPIDTGSLLNNINARLSQKMRTRYAPAELMDTIKDAAERKSMTFEEFENLRSIAAEEIRSSKDGNKRTAASIIRDELENMPLSTDNAQIKALADQARAAAKARFDILEKNPAYKIAVKDTRNAADLEAGLESVSADKFLQQFVHSDTKQASTANLRRLMAELNDQPEALQALRAGTIEHLKEKATKSGNYFGQAGYNKRMAALRGKVDRIFAGDTALQDLRDLGELATWTEHVKPLTGANVSESGNVAIQGMKSLAEAGIQAKTGLPIKMVKGYLQNRKRQTELRKMIEPGAGIIND